MRYDGNGLWWEESGKDFMQNMVFDMDRILRDGGRKKRFQVEEKQ